MAVVHRRRLCKNFGGCLYPHPLCTPCQEWVGVGFLRRMQAAPPRQLEGLGALGAPPAGSGAEFGAF